MSVSPPIWISSNHAHVPNPLSPIFPIWSLGLGAGSGVFSQAEVPLCVVKRIFPQLELATQSWRRLRWKEAIDVVDIIVLHLESRKGFGWFDVEDRGIEHMEYMPNGNVRGRSVR